MTWTSPVSGWGCTAPCYEGLHEDLTSVLNQDVLLELWPTLRRLVGHTVRTVWEYAFPQLAARGRTAA